ncbi:hypothetical protein MG293_000382 [Ovis ammon polii]|uniref:Uncharacterized protein n=1 Tax=Ovis ammon polii TaxID=230172 RepID=A0AAD4YHZ7_OVIAM|nr:hypothetical protein MG293_000382 [Ovis ammon polii]
MTSRPTPLANAETGHPCAAPGQVLGGSLKSPGWGQRTGLAYAGYCEWEARDAKGEAEEGGLESWGRLQGWRETFPAQRRVGMTVAEVEDKVRLPLTPQWGRKESDMTERLN